MRQPRFAHFTIQSRLAAPAEQVWARAICAQGVNDEFFPWLSMSLPAGGLPERLDEPVQLGRCWLKLFGLLPLEWDDVGLERVRPLAFDEKSSLAAQRHWLHRRRVLPQPQGCIVVDRVAFVPRLPALVGFYRGLYRLVFAWRHYRLRRRFGQIE